MSLLWLTTPSSPTATMTLATLQRPSTISGYIVHDSGWVWQGYMSLWYGHYSVSLYSSTPLLSLFLFPPPTHFLPYCHHIHDIVQGMNGPLLTPYKAEKGLQEVLRNLDGTPRSLEEIATRIKLAMDKVTNHLCFTTQD